MRKEGASGESMKLFNLDEKQKRLLLDWTSRKRMNEELLDLRARTGLRNHHGFPANHASTTDKLTMWNMADITGDSTQVAATASSDMARSMKVIKENIPRFEWRPEPPGLKATRLSEEDPCEVWGDPGNSMRDLVLKNRSQMDIAYLLEFSEISDLLAETLLDCPELEECRTALRTRDLCPQLPSGALMFVHPEQAAPALEAIVSSGMELDRNRILVAVDFEEAVREVVTTLQRRRHIKNKGLVAPRPFGPPTLGAMCQHHVLLTPYLMPVVTARTFINLRPS
jgi:hypothetical protein